MDNEIKSQFPEDAIDFFRTLKQKELEGRLMLCRMQLITARGMESSQDIKQAIVNLEDMELQLSLAILERS